MPKIKENQEYLKMKGYKIDEKPDEKSKTTNKGSIKKKKQSINFDLTDLVSLEDFANVLGIDINQRYKPSMYLLNQPTKLHLL